MSILVGSTWIFTVIDVEDSNLIFAENVVKGINYTVKVVDNVISGIVSVAGIKADPETVFFHHTIIDLSQFFKSASDLSAFSGHGFKRDQTAGIIREHFIQSFDNRCNTGFYTGPYVRTGMKNHDITSTGISAGQLQPEKISGKLVSVRVYSISKIDDIGCMDDKFMDIICLHELPGSVNI